MADSKEFFRDSRTGVAKDSIPLGYDTTIYSPEERNPHTVMKTTCKSTFKRYMTPWHPMMTVAVAKCDAQNTNRQKQSSWRMCQLLHIPVQPSGDTQLSDTCTCLSSSEEASLLIRTFLPHLLKSTNLIPVPKS